MNIDEMNRTPEFKALERLASLKNYKDNHGKNDYYLREQPKAWENAIAIVLANTPDYNFKLSQSTPAQPVPVKPEGKDFFNVLESNFQTQIAGYYNCDATEAERDKRNAVIEEYKDLIAIYKSGSWLPPAPVKAVEDGMDDNDLKDCIVAAFKNNLTDLHDEEGNVIRGIGENDLEYAATEAVNEWLEETQNQAVEGETITNYPVDYMRRAIKDAIRHGHKHGLFKIDEAADFILNKLTLPK